tara:strand:- start:299 stop:1021 length:723 start_codon:yes stop_codon:yes gene_type:complete
MRFDEPLTKLHLRTLRSWVKRRIKHEPLQYITGSCSFYGREFLVSPDVLIPRPETERLIDVSIETVIDKKSPSILDIGTGSGCIAITMALEIPDSSVLGVDISPSAKNIAILNRKNFKAKNTTFVEMDILQKIPEKNFDLILSNPPYISKEELPTLMEEVKYFEPKIALTDNDDGLTFYNRYAEIAKALLKKDGYLILEVGIGNHPKIVESIFRKSGYNDIKTFKDYNGDTRIILINNVY